MFKYIEYKKIETEYTVLEFRGGNDDVKVNYFSDNETTGTSIVSIEAENESDIDALIDVQPDEIGCTVIEQDEFKTLVTDSMQINRIRDVVKKEIAKRYSPADEIAMLKKADDDEKRIVYDDYVAECIAKGDDLKAELGY